MQILSRRTLREFWERHPRAETPLKTWFALVSSAMWSGPQDVKAMFGTNVDFVGDNRTVFDIGGNKYRLVVRIAYAPWNRILVKFVGTHAEYDRIDVETV